VRRTIQGYGKEGDTGILRGISNQSWVKKRWLKGESAKKTVERGG